MGLQLGRQLGPPSALCFFVEGEASITSLLPLMASDSMEKHLNGIVLIVYFFFFNVAFAFVCFISVAFLIMVRTHFICAS